MSKLNAKPFIKWAGGKRQLLMQFEKFYPQKLKENQIKRYVEPFIGGGAVFFDLISKYNFEEVILNDINKELILTYKIIKSAVKELIESLKKLEDEFLSLDLGKREIYYYGIREKFNTSKDAVDFEVINRSSIIHCGYFIFLNRTCFNGLYRENKKGYFNVPFGKYKIPKICDDENLRSVNKALTNVILKSEDFEDMERYADENTFFYFDPPYRPLNQTSSFESYSKNGFNDEEQIRLGKFYTRLDKKKALLMLSNSNPKNVKEEDRFFDELYGDFNINEIQASRAINSKASKRGKISEILVVNY